MIIKKRYCFPLLWMVFGLFLSLPSVMAQTNLRHSVAIVYEQPDSVCSARLKDYSLWLSRQGKRDASRYLTALTRKGFGSGVVVEHEGERLLLTNSHVVGTGRYADVAFIQGHDTLLLRHCPCIMQDHRVDLAVLRLPTDSVVSLTPLSLVPLSFSDEAVDDGITVWSAGFPGLAGYPSWQIGQGIVSNADLSFPDWDKRFVQHTAQIDPGSSGGPLLLRTGEGYEIIGINTSKAYAREGVGMAIPVADCRAALRAPQGSSMRALLQAIDTMDVTDYAALYMRMPEHIIQQQDSLFERGEYLEALVLVPNYADTARLSKRPIRRGAKAPQRVLPKSTGTCPAKTTRRAQGEYGIDYDMGSMMKFSGEATLWGPMPELWQAGFEYGVMFATFVRMSVHADVVGLSKSWIYSDDTEGKSYGPCIRYSVGGQVPVKLGPVTLIPYLTPVVGLSLSFSGVSPAVAFGGRVGTDLGIPTGDHMFLLGLDYDLMGYHVFNFFGGGSSSPSPLPIGHGLGFHIGYAF
ncbi:MAG: trypsin-like peptidase domain-containing protein [Paludibacteraceae bacterium]|nr:trypsin-like peptidase domain-containing protein [Paludibacteraceae bacterium]